jgi:hypothetical protein
MAWCRLYDEILDDPKVQKLPAESFKLFINLLCYATKIGSSDGKIGNVSDVSFVTRVTIEAVSSAFQPLIISGLIVTDSETFHVTSDTEIRIAKWKKRQYKSDVSTERVKKYRQKKKLEFVTETKRFCNVSETPPDTDTDTDKKNKIKKDFIIPDWIPLKDWKDFIDMREKKAKAKNTTEALTRIVKRLDQYRNNGHDIALILENSIINGWTGVFEPKHVVKSSKSIPEKKEKLTKEDRMACYARIGMPHLSFHEAEELREYEEKHGKVHWQIVNGETKMIKNEAIA